NGSQFRRQSRMASAFLLPRGQQEQRERLSACRFRAQFPARLARPPQRARSPRDPRLSRKVSKLLRQSFFLPASRLQKARGLLPRLRLPLGLPFLARIPEKAASLLLTYVDSREWCDARRRATPMRFASHSSNAAGR